MTGDMIQDMCFQDLSDSMPHQCNGEMTSMLVTSCSFPEANIMSVDKHDVWGSSVFSLPELGADLQNQPNRQNVERANSISNTNLHTIPSHGCISMQMTANDEQVASLKAESTTVITSTQNVPHLSLGSAGVNSGGSSGKIRTTNPPLASSVVYTPHTNQLSLSSLMSIGTVTVPPNSNHNNNNSIAYKQVPPVTGTMPGNIPTFFANGQGGNNVVMFAPTPSSQTLCITTGTPTMIPCYVFPQTQHTLEVNGAMAYSPMAPAHQSMGTVMCGSWHPTAVSAVGATAHNAANVPAAPPCIPQKISAQLAASAPQPAANFPLSDANSSTGVPLSQTQSSIDVVSNQKTLPKNSPPSYDSLRLQLMKRRQPPGRQRSGTNVHGSLQGICTYFSYNLSAALKQYEQPDAHSTRRGEQVLPVFIQMFPCELRDRTIIVLNRVVEATCGPDIATVVGIEPRSETSFIALVRTNEVWLLIHKLRCRVLMDRHGFWYAENMEQYLRLKEYCEGVRRLPQQMRHFQTDGLPCMPLVVELSRSVNAAAVTSPPAAPSYDEVAPIVTVERHTRSGTATGSNDSEGSPFAEVSGPI